MQVKVFNEGVPGSSMWIEPAGTWEKILAGKSSPDGKYISVNTARRLIAEAVDAWWEKARSQGGTLTQGHDWCGSEGGTPRRLEGVKDDSVIAVEYRSEDDMSRELASEICASGSEGGTPRVIDDGKTSSWSVGESRAALAERIAIENAEYRKLVFADETAAWPPGNYPYDEAPPIESASDRAERIASEIGDRKHDRQVDEI